ncbi:MAG: D-Ala-D-Ala carboxypeptidase family metallohydrolase [Halomonas sp.]
MLPDFTADELRCKGTGELRLAPGFGRALQGLRDALTLEWCREGLPIEDAHRAATMILNSACRAPTHNDAVGGHPSSLHLTEGGRETGGTCAVDVRAPETSPEYRSRLARTALRLGWSVGYHPRFLHLDLRTPYAGLPQAEFDY